jgi:predicted phage terminase large subunit-like protein
MIKPSDLAGYSNPLDYLTQSIAKGITADCLKKPESPVEFAKRVTDGAYLDPPHIQLLNSKLADLAAGKISRLMVTMPPRHGKSWLCSQYFPAWFLGVNPDKRVILTSYEADYAASWGRKVKNLLEEYGHDVFGIRVSRESSASNRWDIAGKLGGMVTAGAGGPITGRGADILIIDDPVKNAEEAASETIRSKIWDWYLSTAYSRLEPGGGVVVIMTRWHEDDLAGKLLAHTAHGGDAWECVDFPAIAEESDILGRSAGEALWPERYDVDALAAIRGNQSVYFWSALYQQRPQPEGGAIFKRSWFRYFRRMGDYYVLSVDGQDTTVCIEDCWKFQTVDPAATEKDQNDWFVCSTWAVTPQRDLLLLNVFREHADTTKHKKIMRDQYQRWAPAFQGVENVSYGLNIIQDCANEGLPIMPLKADRDKISRSRSIAARYETGKVYHLLGADYLDEYEGELLRFPTGKHDDQVDTASYAGIQVAQQSTPEFFTDLARTDQAWIEDHEAKIERDVNRSGLYY